MQMTQERRREPRQRVLKSGKIVFSGMNAVYDCVVRNRSAHGARLRVAAPEFVPSSFTLRIPSDHIDAEAYVTNRCGNELGVFLKV